MLIPLLIAISLARNLTILPTVNELWINDLKDIFGSIDNPSYELTPLDSPFVIVDSINLMGFTNHIMNEQPKSFVSNNKFTQFAVLDLQNIVYWTKQTLPVDTPQFLGKIQLNETCYNLDFIDDNTLIIDCLDSKQFNQFTFLQLGSSTKQTKLVDRNIINQSLITFRKINVLDDDCVLLGQSSVNLSYIDVYDLNSMNNTGYQLNTTIISKIAQIKDKQYQFRLVDFKSKFGLIYVLDESRLMILSYQEEWKLHLQIQLIAKGVAFDVKIVSDFNGNEKFEFVVLTQNGKLYYYNDFANSPIEMNIVGQSIQISNQYILVQQDQNLLQININDKQIVKSKIWNQNKFLVSGLYSTLIEVEKTFTKRYILSNGYIQGQSKSTIYNQSQITLKATYIDTLQKQQIQISRISYQFLNNTDQNLYQINTPSLFENAIQGNIYYENLNPFLSGPNQKYSSESGSSDLILNFYRQIEQLQELFPTDIVFQETIAIDQNQAILIFQRRNLTLQLWGCNFIVPKSGCAPQTIWLNIDVELTKNTFSVWSFEKDFYFAFTSKSNEVQIWEIAPEKIQRIQNIKNKNDAVIQILGVHKNLYILLEKGEIEVYELGLLVEKIIPAEPALQIFNNPYHSNQIIIVKTKTTLIVYRFNFIGQVIEYFQNYNSDIYVSIYDQSFIVVNSTMIQEYLMTSSQIKLTKQLPLYEYKIINPNYAFQSKHNGLLFIPCELNEKISFLIYQPQVLARDALISVINTNIQGDLKNFIISVDGFQTSLFFYQYQKQNSFYQVLKRTQANSIFKSTEKFVDYCQTIDQTFTVSNSFDQQDFTTKLTVLNRMDNITIIDTNLQEILLDENNSTNYLSLGGNWYKGQVVNIKAECNQCPSEIVLNEPIYPLTYNFLDNARIITQFDEDHQVVVNKNELLIIGSNLNQTLKLSLQQEYQTIAIHPKQKYMILAANDDKNTNLLMISCKNINSCSQLQTKTIQLTAANQMQIIQEDYLFISTAQELVIYHITQIENSWTIEQKSSINITTYSPCKGINYFILQQIETDNGSDYSVTLLDSTNQILFLFYRFKNGSLTLVNSGIRNLYDEILNQAQYVQQDTKFIQLLSYSQIFKTITQFIYIKMILITNNVASYGIKFEFNLNYDYQGSQIQFIVNQYGDWTTLAAGSIKSNKLCIPYSNGFNSVILFYNIPTQSQSIIKPSTITSISGIHSNVLPYNTPLVVYVFNTENQQYYLLTNLQRYQDKICVNLYSLNDQPILAITNTVSLDLQQQITIFVTNDFSSASKQFTLKSLYVPFQNSVNIGWIITVIVFASLLVFIILFYMIRRRAIRLSFQNYQAMEEFQLRNI
ncbi:unnamed protein product [Paramecium sonneborni]|uniref:Transmembrane protein n=1 Tax=Paramecium sonneborni TaxID=65129 RepID=A0A8S1R3Y2_9CILI|nr:unnamed protein product [Paramecium sonneborni]